MQEKEAEEMAEEMNANEEDLAYNGRNWHAYAANNLYRAIDKTFDSCGWPHDRSPFLKARYVAISVTGCLPDIDLISIRIVYRKIS